MTDRLEGTPKYIIAQEAVRQLKPTMVGRDNFSFYYFANGTDKQNEANNCSAATQVIQNGSPVTEAEVETIISQLAEPKGRKTNITYAMEIAAKELQALGGGKIILISDGNENCDADPVALARDLQGANIKIETIGIGRPADFSDLGRIALAGGGTFQLADSAEGLADALSNVGPMSGPGGGMPQPLPSPAASGGTADIGAGTGAGTGTGQALAVPAPATQPMVLELDMTVSEQPKKPVAVEIILDVSGSMAGHLEGKQKMALARQALAKALEGLNSDAFIVGFRAYGFDTSVAKTPEASCPNTALLNPIAPNQIAAIRSQVSGLIPYGYTPLAKSLELAGQDLLATDSDKQMIILLTDGEESCGGDPEAIAQDLRAKGIDLEVHIVGFDLEVETAKTMRGVAKAGGGDYYDAGNAAELTDALTRVIEVTANKVDPAWLRTISPVMGGKTPEKAPTLTPGTYTLTDHLPKGEERYFRVITEKGQHGVVRGLIQSRRLIRVGEERVESDHGYAQYQITIYQPDGGEIGGRFVRLYGDPGTYGHVGYSDLTGDGFIFSISSNYDRVHKDALFNIEITDASDRFVGLEAADSLDDTTPVIPLGSAVTGHLGDGDRKDVYKVLLNGETARVSIHLAFREPEFVSRVVIKGLTTDRPVLSEASRGEPYSLVVEVPKEEQEGLMIEIRSNNPSLRSKFSPYEITVTPEESQ